LQLLFAADRLYHLEKEIIPLLKKGVTVICDRYFFSTVAFGNVDVQDRPWLLSINEKTLSPDLVILLKVSPKTCIERIRENRHSVELFEREKILEKVWETYSWLAKKFSYTRIVDGEKPIEHVSEAIQNILIKKFS
ncbi:MAG: dTMP kinase, partial [bacterium]|nr:dTMP kinase [bacterium]